MPPRLIVSADSASASIVRAWLASEEVFVLSENLVSRSGYKVDVHIKSGALVYLCVEHGNVVRYANFAQGAKYLFCCKICCDSLALKQPIHVFSAPPNEISPYAADSTPLSGKRIIEICSDEGL